MSIPPALTAAHVCYPEDMCQLYGSIAERQHMSVNGGMDIRGSNSPHLGVSEWDRNIW